MLTRKEKADYIYQKITENHIYSWKDPRLCFPNGKSVLAFLHTQVHQEFKKSDDLTDRYVYKTLQKAKRELEKNEWTICFNAIEKNLESNPFIPLTHSQIVLPNQQTIANFLGEIKRKIKQNSEYKEDLLSALARLKQLQSILKIDARFSFLEEQVCKNTHFNLSSNEKKFPDGSSCAAYWNYCQSKISQELKEEDIYLNKKLKHLLMLAKRMHLLNHMEILKQEIIADPQFRFYKTQKTFEDGTKYRSCWEYCNRLVKKNKEKKPDKIELSLYQTMAEIDELRRTK